MAQTGCQSLVLEYTLARQNTLTVILLALSPPTTINTQPACRAAAYSPPMSNTPQGPNPEVDSPCGPFPTPALVEPSSIPPPPSPAPPPVPTKTLSLYTKKEPNAGWRQGIVQLVRGGGGGGGGGDWKLASWLDLDLFRHDMVHSQEFFPIKYVQNCIFKLFLLFFWRAGVGGDDVHILMKHEINTWLKSSLY